MFRQATFCLQWGSSSAVDIFRTAITVFCLLFLSMTPVALAKPISAEQAKTAVQIWRMKEAAPLKASLGGSVNTVATFKDASGSDLYHVVYLKPAGFVILPADDRVEPIIGFSSEGQYVDADTNPLGALVRKDLPGRMAHARKSDETKDTTTAATSDKQTAQSKWESLLSTSSNLKYGLASVSDIRVAPLVQSKWNQSTACGYNTYNYYTPNNYVSGCVATAMSQVMRFHQYPVTGVGTTSYTVYVDGTSRQEALMGGDGTGGAYNWNQMPLAPNCTTTDIERQAIGRLLHDAGTAVHMQYTQTSSSATILVGSYLKSIFGYSNAIDAYGSGSDIPATSRNEAINTNLDASQPVILGIFTPSNAGHEVVADGYGYQTETLYHHINMGWGGYQDLWYNLPNIDDAIYGFTVIKSITYNIFPTHTGEIISGRVLDSNGQPLADVTVNAVLNDTVVKTATTNTNGIYALKGVNSSTSYTVTASKDGLNFTSQIIPTGTSGNYSTTTGNKWGVNFTGTQPLNQYTLTVNHAYTSADAVNGGGTISGSGISCSSIDGGTKSGTCSASLDDGSTVTLAAAADANSTFTGWSGGVCTGTGGCSFTINANTTVTGTFAGAYKAKINGGNGYDTLTLAHANAGSGAIILARELHNATSLAVEPFTENLTVTKPLALKGGYNAGFSSNAGLYSTLAGILTVGGSTGSLTLENLIIK